MKCPHCLQNFHDVWETQPIWNRVGGFWRTHCALCPACENLIVRLEGKNPGCKIFVRQVYPEGIARTPLSEAVPEHFAKDYREACNVLPHSEKASAGLSRRCLQMLLREKAGVRNGSLYDEIQQVLDSGKLPSDLAENLDVVRMVGNLAAHPTKNERTGEIVDVEPEEAEWLLDILESLFDFYFVQPAASREKRAKLHAKLDNARQSAEPVQA